MSFSRIPSLYLLNLSYRKKTFSPAKLAVTTILISSVYSYKLNYFMYSGLRMRMREASISLLSFNHQLNSQEVIG